MTITLNGTTGITTPDVTSDSYTGAVAVDASAPDNSLVVDANGNFGVGVTPTNTFHVYHPTTNTVALLESGDPGCYLAFKDDTTTSSTAVLLGAVGNVLQFNSAGAERMRLDTSGNLLVGTTSDQTGAKIQAQLNAVSKATTLVPAISASSSSGSVGLLLTTNSTATRYAVLFENNNGAATVGSISTNSSSTAYNTSSDYRLKEDWQPMTGASERVKALKPVNFAWKVDGSRVDGFLAHEAQAVVPEAVTGEKDAVDADGNPEYQGIDQSKLVPLLTAALQEALAEIETLKARVSALEATNV